MCRCIGGNKYKIRCLRFLLLLIDTMTKLSFIKDSIKLGLTYRFRGSGIIIKIGAWQHPGRNGTGRAEGSTSSSECC